jgi:hypothetical protein
MKMKITVILDEKDKLSDSVILDKLSDSPFRCRISVFFID